MLFKFFIYGFVLIVIGLYTATFILAKRVESDFPPIGDFKSINGVNFHYVDTGPAGADASPAVVFIHGASGNLRDQMTVYKRQLEGKARAIFIDRPGQGYSEGFAGSNDPKQQASSIAKLLDVLEIEQAVIVGHSFGGVVAGAFGVLYPEKTAGLIFLAPVTHPWDTGVDWHYDLGNTPVLGWLFSNLVVVPVGHLIYPNAVKGVFVPNPMPEDYKETSGTRLILRPAAFHENAKDVARVIHHVKEFQHRYKEIKAPTYIFHGDQDDIVSLEIHSKNGLSNDIKGSKLVVLNGVGHKPDYLAQDQITKAILQILSDT